MDEASEGEGKTEIAVLSYQAASLLDGGSRTPFSDTYCM